MTTPDDSAEAMELALNGLLLARLEGPDRDFDEYHYGHLRAWVYLTRDGRLVLVTKYRTRSSTSGHSVPTGPPTAKFMQWESWIIQRLAEDGIDLPPLMVRLPEGIDAPPEMAERIAKPWSTWKAEEKQAFLEVAFKE